jgi:hypothetical protein
VMTDLTYSPLQPYQFRAILIWKGRATLIYL